MILISETSAERNDRMMNSGEAHLLVFPESNEFLLIAILKVSTNEP